MKTLLFSILLLSASTLFAQIECPATLSIAGKSDTITKRLLTMPMSVIPEETTRNRCPNGLVIKTYKCKVVVDGKTIATDGEGPALNVDMILLLRRQTVPTTCYITSVVAVDPEGNEYVLPPYSFVVI